MYFNASMAIDYRDSIEGSFLVYLHPQRTGGTRLKKQLYSWYGKEACYTQQSIKEGFKDWKFIEEYDLKGKKVYAYHSDFWGKNFSKKCYYIASVRDPVYRLYSFYEYCKRKDGHPLKELANKVSSVDFLVEAEKSHPKYIRDFQTLRLCRQRSAEKAILNIEKNFISVFETDLLNKFTRSFGSSVLDDEGVVEGVEKDQVRYSDLISSDFFELSMKFNPEDSQLYQWISGNPLQKLF